MFWQFNLHPTIDTMLTREDCTLGEILDEDDVLQETKSQNRKLIDFFLRPEILEELVDLVLQSPDESKDDCVKYKHANTACEVLTADVYAIIDKLTNNEDLLNKIWSFMEAEPPLNPLLASFFSKVMGVLISRKTSLDAERLAQGNAHQALGSFRRAIDYYIKSLNIAKKVNDKAAEGHACGNLGNAYRALGDFRKAIKYHEKELNIAIEVGDRAGEGRAHCNLGNAYQALDNFKTAIEFHKKDLKIAKEVGNRAGEGRANGNLGNAYWSLGDFRKAIEYHRKDLNIAEEVGDRAREGRAYANLGNASYSLGAFRKAIEFYEKRLTIVIGVGDRAGEGGAYGNLGVAYYSLGDFQKSIDYHKKLLSIAKEVGDRAGERRAYFNLSNAYQALGNTQKASKYHKKFSNIAKQPGNLVEEGSADSNLSKAHKSHGDIRETTECHEEQSNNAREVGDRTEEGVIHSSVGGAHSSMSDLRKDAGYYEVNRLTSSKELDGRAREEEIYLRHCDPLASEAYNRALSKGKTRVLPKEINLRGPLAVEAYNKALSKGKTRVRRIPVMLIGQDRSGKTSLKNSLTGIRFNPDESSTVGIDVDPSFFKVTTEIWKTGETDQEANTKDASFYEQHAAWLVVKNLREGELIPEENSVESVHSEDSFLVDMVTPNTNTMSEGSSVSSREFIKTGHDEFPLDKQLDVSAPPRASRISDSDDGSNVYNTPANQRTDPTNRGSNHLTTSKIPDEVETLIKKLLKEVDKVKGEDDIYSVLWDFGGQSVYYATHPLFLTSRALYLLVYDLSRDPHKTAQPVTKQGMYKKIQDRFETKSNLDCLDFWMTSIASLARRDGAHTKESDSKSLLLPEKLPPVFLVCTNADRPCGGAEPFALAREVYGYLQGKSFKVHLCDDVFVVDNTKSGGESECPEVARLRHSILAVAQELPLMKEEIPIKWLKYEKALQVTLGEGHKWIYLEHARQIAAEVCQIYDNEEFVTLLDFLHDQRILIHFDDTPELNKLVVLDPQWLIDVFKKVITVQLSDCHGKAEIKQLWHKLETAGIIEETLLKHVWNPLIGQHETYESFIAIMEKFGLLCSWPSSDTSCNNKQYLVPSMLMVHPPQDITELIASAELPSLFLKFEPGHVPRSLFPRLVLQFFQWSQNEVWSLLHPQLYKNFARFYTAGDEDCSVILLCHSSFIEIVVHRGNVNPRLLEGIQSKLTISSGPEHESFEVFCARAVYRQLSLMLECMRREFCWLRNMTYQAGFICPVCCHRKVVNYCRTHHKQHCEQEECLHFLSESELHNANQFIICTRAAAAVDNKVHVKTFSAWFISPSEQTTTDEVDGRRFLSGEGGEDRSLARLPSDVVESLTSRSCDPKEIVLQLKESLHLDEKCLGKPNPETKRTIRCLAKRAKVSNRMEVVKHLREITPEGTTGPLLPGNLDIRKIPVCQMRELTMNLSSGEEWKDVAEKLGLTSTEIRYLDKRTLNPCDAALAFISQRCHINVDDLYDALTDCGYPVLADTL